MSTFTQIHPALVKRSDPRESPTIVIVGGGASGALVAVQLLRAGAPVHVVVIERDARLACGVAYATERDAPLLNVPAAHMSALPDDPDHFVDWVRGHLSADPDTPAEVWAQTFAPRRLYGHYLQSLLDEAVLGAPAGTRFTRVTDEAVAVDTTDGALCLVLATGRSVVADACVLALGHFPPHDPPLGPAVLTSARYRGRSWTPDVLAGLDRSADVLLLGTGLAAMDLALELHERLHRGTVHLLSRTGLLPQAHCSARPLRRPIAFADAPTARALVRAVRHEVARAAAEGDDWRPVIDALRPLTQSLWERLALAERRRLLRHVRPYWEMARHRMAPQAAAIVASMMREGRLRVHTGSIVGAWDDASGVRVLVEQRRSAVREYVSVARLINCTGPESEYRRFHDPLVASLREQGLVRVDALGLGLDVAPNGAVREDTGRPSARIFTLGPPCKGTRWETAAIPEIRAQAAVLVPVLVAAAAARPSAPQLLDTRDDDARLA